MRADAFAAGCDRAEAVALEAFLARLYTDEALRRAFLAAPQAVAQAQGLAPATACALQALDRDGLELVARSLAPRRAAAAGGADGPVPHGPRA